ncbi:SPASM domain-containing protein [Vibrio parahaemolyticus]|uniref:radical SAM/SPASM domain-containing protein n=1 Tax=Vibrio parahaemolyticus TaxID=670 RepID=UPI0022B5AEC8|nr:radical SAM protein [Vibrio parahaemolyticus]MBE5179464.1 4Fe-4S cluster-binding domain-containing protein [Vibrio parahaemolyticus]MCZ6401713.1 SPASM domain-containing protein [Vibrio parahaemolyticus]
MNVKGMQPSQSAEGLVFQANARKHLFLTNGSRVYTLPEDIAKTLEETLVESSTSEFERQLSDYGLSRQPYISDTPLRAVPLHNVSLAIAQKCNLGCKYCYASGGNFGQAEKNMPIEIAKQSIDRVLENVKPNERCNIAYMGGEPLINRSLLREITDYALQQASLKKVHSTFSITTNGTLLTQADAEFFEEHGFAVTLSLDGIEEVHNLLRPFKGGRGSYSRIMKRVQPLLDLQHKMQVSARITVTPLNLDLRKSLDWFIEQGFHSVGFSPMLSSPNGQLEMSPKALQNMLARLIECADEFEQQTIAGKRYPFTNIAGALQEIHKGTHRPYPCGAGAGYMGVSAEGDFVACHRFVGDRERVLGSSSKGVDAARQANWLAQRHVDTQSPCSECWARYLCGGGCHHEVISKGRPACDFIRGWLKHCLGVYVTLQERRPDFFQSFKNDNAK